MHLLENHIQTPDFNHSPSLSARGWTCINVIRKSFIFHIFFFLLFIIIKQSESPLYHSTSNSLQIKLQFQHLATALLTYNHTTLFFKKKNKSTYQQWFPAARVFLPTASVLLKLAARAARAPPASAPARAPRRKTPLARPAALVACATPRSAPATGLPLRMGLETARLTLPTPFKSGHRLPIFQLMPF